jgi:hypothetical protein
VRLSAKTLFIVKRSLASPKTASSPWSSSDQGEVNFLLLQQWLIASWRSQCFCSVCVSIEPIPLPSFFLLIKRRLKKD